LHNAHEIKAKTTFRRAGNYLVCFFLQAIEELLRVLQQDFATQFDADEPLLAGVFCECRESFVRHRLDAGQPHRAEQTTRMYETTVMTMSPSNPQYLFS